MKKKALRLRLLIPSAVICVLVVVMAAASNITSSDPLVSLSYLNGTLKNQMITELQTTMNAKAAELDAKLSQRISGIKTSSSPQSSFSATHNSVGIPANSSYIVPSGSEFLFISGVAAAQAAGLSDLTDGTSVAIQGELVANHLYTATASVTVKASETARILIRK